MIYKYLVSSISKNEATKNNKLNLIKKERIMMFFFFKSLIKHGCQYILKSLKQYSITCLTKYIFNIFRNCIEIKSDWNYKLY
jgi:peptidoglycan biosynthesis protein MviN/MurJ (putative lipid II flippase)